MKSIKDLYRIGSGPSSSHTMGPQYACNWILKHYPEANSFIVTLHGSLALTGKGHLTDEIILLTLGRERTEIKLCINEDVKHPNTLDIEAYKDNDLIVKHRFYSIGGGAIEIEGIPPKLEKEIYPEKSFAEIKELCNKNNWSLVDYVYNYEGIESTLFLGEVFDVMEAAIKRGLTARGVLPGGLEVQRKASSLNNEWKTNESSESRHTRLVAAFAYATSEENASGGIIVTAPTCGACGVLPAVLFYLMQRDHLVKKDIMNALAVASVIGNVIKSNASISGAFAGCQSEVGSACSMAAAAAAYLQGCNIEEIEYAAEIAMEHHLGLTCDPVKGLVQIPCIERNAVAALRALDSASLAALLKGSRKISFDTVVKTMLETGKDLHNAYKETSIGGLAKHYESKGC